MSSTKAFKPTDIDRKTVEALAGYGLTEHDICLIILNPNTGRPLTRKTMRKHFRSELDTGHVKANAKVAESLYKQATSGKNVTASIFWLKTRARWKETQRHEHTVSIDVSNLTNDQLEHLVKHGRTPA